MSTKHVFWVHVRQNARNSVAKDITESPSLIYPAMPLNARARARAPQESCCRTPHQSVPPRRRACGRVRGCRELRRFVPYAQVGRRIIRGQLTRRGVAPMGPRGSVDTPSSAPAGHAVGHRKHVWSVAIVREKLVEQAETMARTLGDRWTLHDACLRHAFFAQPSRVQLCAQLDDLGAVFDVGCPRDPRDAYGARGAAPGARAGFARPCQVSRSVGG
jgi:hypothetical protein